MNKWVMALSTVGLSGALLVGCGTAGNNSAATSKNSTAPAASDIKGTITVLTNRTDMQANGMLAKYSKEFEKKYPGTTVKWQTYIDPAPIRAQMNAGTYPDVMQIISGITPDELPQFFAPLDNLGLNSQMYFTNYQTYGGKTYGLASGGDSNGIVYNKAAFAKAGITSVPVTLNEFYADCQKLKDAGIVPLAMNYQAKWPLANWINVLPDLVAKNPNYMNTLVNSSAPFTASTPLGQSLTIARTLVDKGYVEKDLTSNDWEKSKTYLAQGKYAMYFLGNWVIPQVIQEGGTKSSNVGYFPIPTDNSGKKPVAVIGPDYFYAANKNSKNVATAEAFIKWMLLDSGYANYAGFIPPVKSQKATTPQIAEFEADASSMLQGVPDSPKLTKIESGAQLDFSGGGAMQPLLTGNFQQVMQQYNQAWASAKSIVG